MLPILFYSLDEMLEFAAQSEENQTIFNIFKRHGEQLAALTSKLVNLTHERIAKIVNAEYVTKVWNIFRSYYKVLDSQKIQGNVNFAYQYWSFNQDEIMDEWRKKDGSAAYAVIDLMINCSKLRKEQLSDGDIQAILESFIRVLTFQIKLKELKS